MELVRFWQYLNLRYFFLFLVLANLAWQLWFSPTLKLIREDNWFWALPLVVLVLLALSGATLFFFNLWRIDMRKGTAKIIQTAMDQGYQAQNVLPLAYAASPRSEPLKARATGAPLGLGCGQVRTLRQSTGG